MVRHRLLCAKTSMSRTIEIILLSMLLISMMIFAVILNVYFRHFISDIVSSSLHNTTQRQVEYINLWFDQYLLKVNSIAQNKEMRSLDQQRIEAFLNRQHDDNIIFDSLVYINREGYSIVNTRYYSGIYYGDREYFKSAIKGKSYIDGPMISRTANRPVFVFAAPVIPDEADTPSGVVVGVIFMDSLASRLNAADPAVNGITYILSHNNMIAVADGISDTTAFGSIGEKYMKDDGIKAALSRDTGVKGYTNVDGKAVLGSYRWVAQRNIGIVTEVPVQNFYDRVISMTFTALGLIGIVWVAMFMSFAIFMRRTIIAPLKEVAYRALRLAEGHLDERMEYRSRNEIGRVVEAFNHMADELQASYEELQLDKEELEAQQAELIEKNSLLERVSITDALTGLYNRGYMINRLAGDLSYSQRYGQPLSCLMMDLDFFKAINDTYGHQAGDLVLRQLAQIINMNLRKSDVAVRYGGEEFFVICPNTEGNGAVMLGERIRRAVQEHDFDIGDGNVIRMTISIGVAYIAPHDIKDIVQAERDIITRADSALYIAKGDGRNNVKLFAK